MKSKELMIDDWVQGTIDHFERWQWEAVDYFNVYEDKIEPIPITKEILKANGFNDEMELYINDNCVLEYDTFFNHLMAYYLVGGDKIKYMDMYFIHVHELQHALRLIGLNKLADNFKIQ